MVATPAPTTPTREGEAPVGAISTGGVLTRAGEGAGAVPWGLERKTFGLSVVTLVPAEGKAVEEEGMVNQEVGLGVEEV